MEGGQQLAASSTNTHNVAFENGGWCYADDLKQFKKVFASSFHWQIYLQKPARAVELDRIVKQCSLFLDLKEAFALQEPSFSVICIHFQNKAL
jgi:hypothetical protein